MRHLLCEGYAFHAEDTCQFCALPRLRHVKPTHAKLPAHYACQFGASRSVMSLRLRVTFTQDLRKHYAHCLTPGHVKPSLVYERVYVGVLCASRYSPMLVMCTPTLRPRTSTPSRVQPRVCVCALMYASTSVSGCDIRAPIRVRGRVMCVCPCVSRVRPICAQVVT